MTAGVCEAYYKDNIDSFILCSSDSDYWGLISSVKDAHFLVMYEYSKCGQSIKDALTKRCIFHCSIDDFYTGNASDYLPHNYPRNCVVYTGTHDNETVSGWYKELNDQDRKFADDYLNLYGRKEEELSKNEALVEYLKNSVKTEKVIRDKNDKWRKLTDNFKQNCRLTEIDKTVKIITSS